ncbi:Biotin transport ATP-binding protein BioM [Methylobacterium crusticola]|uniref:Biotin transport ATP-binding protein BioM n=1 Tax=Methylobacterium crusticola TaxID=1697972 RepID=A0ABQ4QZ55_9HYPH|nr:ABC transporter ATP-binding protein [Methylobacterium crusticola]GJD50336.1 Biotin transport ATP-binding protein BioM [Methylobacterium crusticola]
MAIVFDRVRASRHGRPVLHETALTLRERRIGVVGPNGSGKSSLARLINGLLLPDAGSVRVDGLDTRADARAVRRRVGFVFQNPADQIVFPVVSEDIGFGLRNLGLARGEIAARSAAVLERFGLAHLAERPSHALSGGEKQMVALAAVLVTEPAIVVFDEPTTLLDLRHRNRVRAAIAGLAQTAIVVSHDLALLEGFERVLVMDAGRVVADDAAEPALRWYVDHLS